MEKLADPTRFGNAVCNATVFSLGAGAGNGRLAFGGPGDQAVAEKDTKPRRGFSRIRATRPIGVGIGHEIKRGGLVELKSKVGGTPEIAKNTLDELHVSVTWRMHEETDLLKRIREVRSSESEVLEGTRETAIMSGVG